MPPAEPLPPETAYFFAVLFFALAAVAFFFFIGAPQHQIVLADAPQQSTVISRPHGTHVNFEPFFRLVFAIFPLLDQVVRHPP